jgi:ligand-binding SRPBCC domain-containing protein
MKTSDLALRYRFNRYDKSSISNRNNAPIEKVYEYYTNPDNIQEVWPQNIVKESENVSGSKSEERLK